MQNRRKGITLGQFGRRLMHDLLQQIQNPHRPSTGPVPSRRIRRIKGKPSHGQLHDGQAHAPDIGSDGVRAPLDPFGSHVGRGADKGVGDGVDGLGGHAKIAQFDVAARVEQDIGRFDIAVHDAMGFVQIHQTGQDRLCDLAQDVHSHGAEVL